MRFPPLNPELLVDAISASGYELTGQIVALGCLENRVFWLPTENQQDLVMKVYRPGRWQQNELDEEHDILLDCEAADLDVVAPIDIEDGFTLGQIENDGVACSFALFPFIRGRCRDELSLESCEYVGGLIADLHLSFERYETNSSRRPKDSVDDYLLWFHGSAEVPVEYRCIVDKWLTRFERALFCSEKDWIHGDCHLGNILWRDEDPWLIDFDDVGLGWRGQDLWLIAPGNSAGQKERRRALFAGYGDHSLYRDVEEKLPDLRALRMMNYVRWISTRWPDPAFKTAFPDFGSPGFWLREAHALTTLFEHGE